ncbi:S1C family serine protease [Desulfofalx alkaliphila]|uniref:S1C family serine protease n=1 Tax=Desulfofalx alkaliphila TaxID=105483 RepID=UPI000AB6722E|nr:S1C family serine protease [Desulfofalx alkaliphila]
MHKDRLNHREDEYEFELDEDGLPPEDLLAEIDPDYQEYDEHYDDEDDDDLDHEAAGRSPWVRIIAFITAMAFVAVVVGSTVSALNLPMAGLLAESLKLKKDMDSNMLHSVVQIRTVARKPDAMAIGQSSGTGFNIHPNGIIVTNHHVIEGALNMAVTFPNGQIYRAEKWISRPEYDLAIIKLDGKDLPKVPINSDFPPASGDSVRIVGNPLGYNNVVVEGTVDGYLRVQGTSDKVIALDAPIYPGNSGSPVFDSSGAVIGVVFATARITHEGEERVRGLAVPIEKVLNLQRNLLNDWTT